MSQGEFNALGLALFLPRATAAASPFRFVVLDDPVQAMDPAKVDGLARVLAELGQTRQVVVFSHDDRLPESLRRLARPATVCEVVRSDRSGVDVRAVTDPVAAALDDARALARTEDLPDDLRVVGVAGCCRDALEAACLEVLRRVRIGRGTRHEDVDRVWAAARTTTARVSLAVFDDPDRTGDVYARLNRWGNWATPCLKALNARSHGSGRRTGSSPAGGAWTADLVGDTERLVREVRRS